MQCDRPAISLVLPTLNALPHVKRTVQALRCQTCQDFELLVQDGGSTDATVAYMRSLKGFNHIDVDTSHDSGLGQAYNRGIARARGDYVGLIAADEALYPRALSILLSEMKKRPDAAITFGAVDIVDAYDNILQTYVPPSFDLLRFMHCQITPTTAGLLSRKILGNDLFYDETMKTCPDYDFWMRVGSRFTKDQIVRVDHTILSARGDPVSMSFRPEMFNQFCKDKLFILDRFIATQGTSPLLAHLRCSIACGIYCWAAEMIYNLEGVSERFAQFLQAAMQLDDGPRVAHLCKVCVNFPKTDPNSESPSAPIRIPHPTPDESALRLVMQLNLLEGVSHPHWNAETISKDLVEYQGSDNQWGYVFTFQLNDYLKCLAPTVPHWLILNMEILSGRVGIGLIDDGDLKKEQLRSAFGPTRVLISLSGIGADTALIIRNGGVRRSRFRIVDAKLMQQTD
jgi:glycosyltransferase involved in cell wall biosynthesis